MYQIKYITVIYSCAPGHVCTAAATPTATIVDAVYMMWYIVVVVWIIIIVVIRVVVGAIMRRGVR